MDFNNNVPKIFEIQSCHKYGPDWNTQSLFAKNTNIILSALKSIETLIISRNITHQQKYLSIMCIWWLYLNMNELYAIKYIKNKNKELKM